MKRFFPMLISTALILSAFGSTQTNAATKAGATLTQRGNAAIRFTKRQIREVNRRLRYTIKAAYPQALGGDARFIKLNQELKSLALKGVADFKKDFAVPEQRGPSGSTYDLSYSLELATNHLVSFTFYVDPYYEGAAHPLHLSFTFNYDLDTGHELKLADLFRPHSSYLKPISDYAISDLSKQLADDLDLDWIKRGAGPEADNYKSWAITREGLKVTFDPYQVASYAAGPHEVVIPFRVLRSIIEPNGPLSRMQN